MNTPDQVYKTAITTTPEKLWAAITNPEFTKQYWFGNANVAAEWKQGAPWQHKGMDTGTVHCEGVIVELIPNKKLALTWYNPGETQDVSLVTFDIVQKGEICELTITHGDFIDNSEMAPCVANGWPKVVGNMKEWLETGRVTSPDAPCDHKAA